MLKKLKKIYSPNFDLPKRRSGSIKYLILHYTGMKNEKKALNRLTNPLHKVSCHYLINNSGEIINIVPDLYTAWHAGKSGWKKIKSLNKYSIGIEISNPGHDNKYKQFKKKQIYSLFSLITELKKKYHLKNKNILGHSDIAPDRKKDPGEKFPWELMSKKKLTIWHNITETKLKKIRNKSCNKLEVEKFLINLHKIGYNAKNKTSMIKAFQRRFRQKLINGKVDKECLFISFSLVKKF